MYPGLYYQAAGISANSNLGWSLNHSMQ